MKTQAEIVIVGGGVVGCSILYHLAKFGCKDVLLLERSELTSGSSWHAAGQIHTISSDPNISRLQAYTISLYREIEKISGHNVGLHETGGFYLASNNDWMDYLKRERSKARYMGLDQEFISLEEVKKRHPLIDTSRYIGALWDPVDGDVDPSGVTYAYAKAAKHYGGDYETNIPVLETNQRADGTWDVVTAKGTIHAEKIVNAGGLWAREVGQLAGIDLPVQPMEHHYIITETIPEIAEMTKLSNGKKRLPAGVDYEGNIYFRQERDGMLLGTYEPVATPWQVTRTPQDFGHELLQPKLENIESRLELGFERIPALATAGLKNIVNGPFTFGPDGSPLIGPVAGVRNYWVAVGVMAGFCQAGGVGLAMAEWMLDGEPSMDVWAMDVARFGEFASPQYGTIKSTENYERRFILTFPNETLPKGRRQKTTAIYDRLIEKGAVMADGFGLENALWFADNPKDAFENLTFKRSRAHDYVAREVEAVRNHVGAIEIANFSKHHFIGTGARAFLDRILAGKLPKKAGRIALSPLLTKKGKLYGDLTVAYLGQKNGIDEFMLFGSGGAQEMHRRWFESHLTPQDNTIYTNMSDIYHGIAISGPKSGALLAKICRENVSNDAFKFRDIRQSFAGTVPALIARISFSGEQGYEIYCKAPYQLQLFETIEQAGKDLGLKWYGARALLSLRLEKNWGVWTMEFRPDFNLVESGMDAFVDWDKDFIGKQQALEDVKTGAQKQLVGLVIEDNDHNGEAIDVSGDEAILSNGEAVSYVTSGGYAHHVQKSMAMGYLPVELIKQGSNAKIDVEINGTHYPATIVPHALYDPEGKKMRG